MEFKENAEIVYLHLTNLSCAALIQECEKNKGTIKINYFAKDKSEIKTLILKKDVHFTLPKFWMMILVI